MARSGNSMTPVDMSASAHARFTFVGLDKVQVAGSCLLGERRSVVSESTIFAQYERLVDGGYLERFRDAALGKKKSFAEVCFLDSDVYKWIEAASWVLSHRPDRKLSGLVDSVIAEIAPAQCDDGYLNTYVTTRDWLERWTDFDLHELYCAGHCIQAAIAHNRVTGRLDFYDVAIRFADLICATFGSNRPRQAIPGHPEIEMALIELWRLTGNQDYLVCAQYFIEARGKGLLGRPLNMFPPEYSQDHRPLREMESPCGHAVRAMYYMCGAADLYAEAGDVSILETLDTIWRNMVGRQLYITGALGARYEGESFGAPFELPNARAYAETCAAIGSVMWNARMLAITGDPAFADLAERTLYNAVLPGLSQDGAQYFYQNPLSDEGGHRRKPWYEVACCPPNIARTLACFPSFVFALEGRDIYVNFYCESRVKDTSNNPPIDLAISTAYPWSGYVRIDVGETGEYGVMLRIPGWADGDNTIVINGCEESVDTRPGRYVAIRRGWKAGDVIELNLPMEPKWYRCHPYVDANYLRLALARGPIQYCVESADQPNVNLEDIHTDCSAPVAVGKDAGPDNSISLCFQARAHRPDPTWGTALYSPAGSSFREAMDQGRAVRVRAVPYFSWGNREPGQMRVWIKEQL